MTKKAVDFQLKIADIEKKKNRILVHICDERDSIFAYHISLETKIEYDAVFLLLEELRDDGFVEIDVYSHRDKQGDYFASITNRGKIFITHNGYRTSAVHSMYTKLMHNIREHAVTCLLGVLVSIITAYLIFKLGWN